MKKLFIFSSTCCLLLFSISYHPAFISRAEALPSFFGGSDIPGDAQKVLSWCKTNVKTIQKAMSRGDVFYEKVGTPRSVYSKQLAEKDVFQFYPMADLITRSPIYTKDHNRLYFTALDTTLSKTNLFYIPFSGAPQYVFTYDGEFRYYDISPDYNEILFNVQGKEKSQIKRYNVQTKKIIDVTTPTTGAQFPNFSPDGENAVFTIGRRLVIRNLRTGADKVLVNDAFSKELPKWSPDGRWIAYQASATLKAEGYDIYKVEVSTGKVTRLTLNPDLDANPNFDKTSQWVIYITTPQNSDVTGNRISVIDINGDNQLIDPTSLPKCWFPVY